MQQVLITGSTSGIGKQLAEDYCAAGWQVIACGRNQEVLAQLAEYGMQTLCFDIGDKEQVKASFDSLQQLPQLLIFNAGTCEYIDRGRIDSDLFKRVFDSNIMGLMYCIEATQDRMSAGTRVAIMGSSSSYFPFTRAEAYASSKAAISYFARSWAVDVADQGIAVSLISPGFVKTPLTDLNDFPMPMLVTTEQASDAIRRGLAKGKTEVHFPRRFSYLLKFFEMLPYSWQFHISKRLVLH